MAIREGSRNGNQKRRKRNGALHRASRDEGSGNGPSPASPATDPGRLQESHFPEVRGNGVPRAVIGPYRQAY